MSSTSTRNTEFAAWLAAELTTRHWRAADLARAAAIDTGLLSRIMRGQQRISAALCAAVAAALGLPVETVFRAAGYLPALPVGIAGEQQELAALYARLSPAARRRLRGIARLFYAEEQPAGGREGN